MIFLISKRAHDIGPFFWPKEYTYTFIYTYYTFLHTDKKSRFLTFLAITEASCVHCLIYIHLSIYIVKFQLKWPTDLPGQIWESGPRLKIRRFDSASCKNGVAHKWADNEVLLAVLFILPAFDDVTRPKNNAQPLAWSETNLCAD